MLALRNISGVKRNMSLSQRVTHYRVIGDLYRHCYACSTEEIFLQHFERFPSEFIENFEEMFLRYVYGVHQEQLLVWTHP